MESFARDPQLTPVPRVVRWNLDDEMVPTTTVDSTCMVDMARATIIHDTDQSGFCACGCRHFAGQIVATPIVQDIMQSMNGDGCDCG